MYRYLSVSTSACWTELEWECLFYPHCYSLCPLPEANVMQQSGMRCGPLAGMAQLARQRNAHGQQWQRHEAFGVKF